VKDLHILIFRSIPPGLKFQINTEIPVTKTGTESAIQIKCEIFYDNKFK